MNAITEWAKAHGFNVPGNGDYWSPQEKANLVAAGMPKNLVSPVTDWAIAHGFNVPAAGDYWGPDEIQNLIQAGMPQEIANQSGEYAAGTAQLNEKNRAQAQQAKDNHGNGLLGGLGPLAQLAALIPGPQQPFLLAANAANNLSQGNLIGAGLNAFGAYSGGWDGLSGGGGGMGADTTAFEAGGAGGLQDWGGQTLANAGIYDSAIGDIPWNDPSNYGYENAFDSGAMNSALNSTPSTSFLNPDGTWGSTLANSGPGGSGVVESLGASGGNTPWMTDPGIWGGLTSGAGLSGVFGQAGNALGAGSILGALGRAIPGLLGAYASSRATDQYKGLADQFASYGAPYRQRLSDLYANPSGFLSSQEVQKPVQMASDIMARSLSTQGNPTGSGNALQQLQSYSADQLFGRLGQEKDRLAGFGGLSAYNQEAPSAAANVISSSNNTANALMAGANNVFNPPKTLAQQYAEFKTLSGA